jgi:hypothetical protein
MIPALGWWSIGGAVVWQAERLDTRISPTQDVINDLSLGRCSRFG